MGMLYRWRHPHSDTSIVAQFDWIINACLPASAGWLWCMRLYAERQIPSHKALVSLQKCTDKRPRPTLESYALQEWNAA
ncbi:hypothetical protein SKAU_G00293800 [Synaphobranchus kaupii]|uniref:Uncharacterized protein n=1 Tax=Synaphobranchus kaupii TaxID=118154 RepID=A0A9Q1EUA3_SYNKA|nr:hypothetical protein SKAU_G00293800 [Synaphobranchus kaupii]